jgi:fumarate hydratase class II
MKEKKHAEMHAKHFDSIIKLANKLNESLELQKKIIQRLENLEDKFEDKQKNKFFDRLIKNGRE